MSQLSLEEQLESCEGRKITKAEISDGYLFIELDDYTAFTVGTDEDDDLVFARYLVDKGKFN